MDSLPLDDDILERLFGEEVRAGEIAEPLSIADVWKNSYSENTSRKVWAAKYVARHPNLVALELSNFKCGHDAPIYSVVEEIIEQSGTPYFCFKDIDENKPAGSIKIRIETIDYFLRALTRKTSWPGNGARDGSTRSWPNTKLGCDNSTCANSWKPAKACSNAAHVQTIDVPLESLFERSEP